MKLINGHAEIYVKLVGGELEVSTWDGTSAHSSTVTMTIDEAIEFSRKLHAAMRGEL